MNEAGGSLYKCLPFWKLNSTSSLHLSPLDCYHLGLELYEEQDYLGAAKWLQVAAHNYTLSRHRDLFNPLGAPRWQVYRDLGRTLLKLSAVRILPDKLMGINTNLSGRSTVRI